MKLLWKRLVQFVATDGRVLHGEPILPTPGFDLGYVTPETKLQVKVISGEDLYDTTGKTKFTGEVAVAKRLLGPLGMTAVPILRCVGLNYRKHVIEAKRTMPPTPFIFFKPSTCVIGHDEPVHIPKVAQDNQADYEGELCFVIGKPAKDVSPQDALSYIAAYTCGNDISSRKLQRDKAVAGPVPQWGFSKGFDTFAPLGPCLVSSEVIQDPSKLHLQTLIDGQLLQDEGLADLIFDCAAILSYLSQGTTLEPGSIIMTGTPGGTGAGQIPPRYLTPGTVMEVRISGIGTLRNSVVFD